MLRLMSAFSALAIFAAPSVTAQTSPELPAGWERPTDADLAGPNWQFRNDRPDRHARAVADFDGDGAADTAELLLDQKNQKVALFVFLSGQPPMKLEESRIGRIGNWGIAVQKPGYYQTACGMGYSRCNKEPTEITLSLPGIDSYMFESASSVYYWTINKFVQVWTSD